MQLLQLLLFALIPAWISADTSQIPSAGHALLFHDNIVVKKDFNNFPTSQLTFEAWISTSDYCHSGAILSYAIDSQSDDENQRISDFNHFVIFEPKNLIACHDYQFIDLFPDYAHKSCHAAYNNTYTANFVERDGAWHHLAVTWDGQNNGRTKIYMNGMLVAEAMNTPTRDLQPNGALMLGAEQDCFGGCTDPHQGYYGLMDEVRIWKVVRTQPEIMQNMRMSRVIDDDNLVAYWQFNDPDLKPGDPSSYLMAMDSSKYGNHLVLRTIPSVQDVTIESQGQELSTKAIVFDNNFAFKPDFTNMPEKDFTIEFWAKSGKLKEGAGSDRESLEYAEFFSFATISQGDGDLENDQGYADRGFMDDAIRIERYLTEFQGSKYLWNARVATKGSISIHINANRQGNGKKFDNWLDFNTAWTDDSWHHIAVTWEYATGNTKLYFDGQPSIPFWVSNEGVIKDKDPGSGGVDPHMGGGVTRSSKGSLVLGQNQECYGGCFSPSKAFDGQMAVLRIWDQVLPGSQIQENMMREKPLDSKGLVSAYYFNTQGDMVAGGEVVDEEGSQVLLLGASGPTWEHSDAPLTDMMGKPFPPPSSATGYALKLHDQQVLMHTKFENFPETAITVEFWMKSVDACRMGVPFSYAAGSYQSLDNSFLIFDYNDWGVAVMEDEGTGKDHNSGISATDGQWHHIAVSWTSDSGRVSLYQDARLVWVVKRGQGKRIPSMGTLVVGREQDCVGGCFDSAAGAAGSTEEDADVQFGAQDFYGVIDEMRVWNRELSADEIQYNWQQDQSVYAGKEESFTQASGRIPSNGLVAWWTFDEGSGYIAHDVSGNKHDLNILEHPDWVLVGIETSKRSETVCGNGIREGLEECDTGGTGDGCTSDCKIRSGYVCVGDRPSTCTNTNLTVAYQQQIKRTYDELTSSLRSPSPDSGSSESKKVNGAVVVLVVVVILLVVVVALGAVAYIKREWIYDHFPGVERGVRGLQDKFSGFGNNKLNYHQYDVVALDPESSNLASGFGSESNGNEGAYAKLSGGGI